MTWHLVCSRSPDVKACFGDPRLYIQQHHENNVLNHTVAFLNKYFVDWPPVCQTATVPNYSLTEPLARKASDLNI